jgi:tRNA-splicing ligase RtcB
VRLLRSGLSRTEIGDRIVSLVDGLFRNIPSGVGSRRKDLKLTAKELSRVLQDGVQWAVTHGYGEADDLDYIEAEGCIPDADPGRVSDRAKERGRAQLGTLGSGNHFIEIGYVDEIYHTGAARVFGLEKDRVTVLIHTGSRGLGHQVCDDFIKVMLDAARRYRIDLVDRQLCCAPVDCKEGRDYLAAMACAANYAFVNRQVIMHWTRETFEQVLQLGPRDLGMELVYDVCHNMAKLETHEVNGVPLRLCVHRKGATRAFPAGHADIPEAYREVGQPVLVPGDMGSGSYVLVGSARAYKETYGSSCHGAGRVLSRGKAKQAARGRSIARELEEEGIIVRGASKATLVEEIPEAYKNVDDVVQVLHQAGISEKVVRLKPLGVIKG